MKKIIGIAIATAVVVAESAQAANFGVIVTAPGLFNVLALGAAVFGVVGALKVRDLVRGGLLSKSWQFLLFAALSFGLAQLVTLLGSMELVSLPNFVVPLLWAMTVAFFAWGIFITKRTLDS